MEYVIFIYDNSTAKVYKKEVFERGGNEIFFHLVDAVDTIRNTEIKPMIKVIENYVKNNRERLNIKCVYVNDSF